MNPLDPAPALQDRGVIIGQSELLRTILLAMVIRKVIDRQLLASRYVRDILAQVQQQLDAIERLDRESEKPN
jgi:hypothetical protein